MDIGERLVAHEALLVTTTRENKRGRPTADLSPCQTLIFSRCSCVFQPMGDSLIQQQYEEIRQLRQDLHRVQNVCSSAEKEMRYERDKNLDIKKQHILLQKENTKVEM